MKSFTITEADDGIRLNRYLERCVPALPLSMLHKYLRTKRIKRNGKRCEASDRLQPGDLLELYIPDDFFVAVKKKPDFLRASRDLEVVYEDARIAVLFKPAGLLAHEDKSGFGDTLVNRFLLHLYEAGEYDPADGVSFTPALCNRIDRGTEGLVLAAKSGAAASALGALIRERRVSKTYLCVTTAQPPRDGVYRAFLSKDETTNKVTVKKEPFGDAKEIVTGFRTLAQRRGLWLVEAELFTGRTHQIRAHLAFLGAPILGDLKYGSAKLSKKYEESRQLLCAHAIELRPEPDADPLLADLAGRRFVRARVDFVERYFPDVRLG